MFKLTNERTRKKAQEMKKKLKQHQGGRTAEKKKTRGMQRTRRTK